MSATNLRPIEFQRISEDPEVQAAYERLRLRGQSHNMAEILATRTFPGTRTDADLWRGKANGNQFETCPGLGDYYRSVAESQGVDTTGKLYMRGLADFPGDPTAWVSSRGDIERVARDKGYAVHGLVEVPHDRYRECDPDVPVAADIVESEAQDILAENPGLDPAELRYEIARLRSGEIDNDELHVSAIPEGAIGPERDW